MRVTILVLLALICSLPVISNVYAENALGNDEYIDFGGSAPTGLPVIDADKLPYGTNAINKLDRGVVNSATFWMELPAEVARVSKERDPFAGLTIGVVHGAIATVFRAGTAVFDTLTFFAPPYDKPVMKPEYAYKRCDDKMQDLFW